MKTSTRHHLKPVATNLYRHQVNYHYYGIVKISGRRHGPAVLKTSKGVPITDLAMAKRVLRDWIAGLEETLPDGRGDMTLAALLETFVRLRKGKSDSTKTAESGMVTHFRKHFPKPMDATVRSVVHSDIATWLATTGHEGRTYDRWRLFARQLFDIAEADGIVTRSPFDAKRIPRAKKETVQRHAPTVEEFTKIVNEIRKPTRPPQNGKRGGQRPLKQDDSADFAAFLGLAGVGQAEASSLQWAHIEKSRIRFTRQKTKKHFYVPIYPWLLPLLDDLRKKAGPKPSGHVFKVDNVKHSLASACQRLGFPHFTQRSLRQGLIGRLWKSGVDRKIIAKCRVIVTEGN